MVMPDGKKQRRAEQGEKEKKRATSPKARFLSREKYVLPGTNTRTRQKEKERREALGRKKKKSAETCPLAVGKKGMEKKKGTPRRKKEEAAIERGFKNPRGGSQSA